MCLHRSPWLALAVVFALALGLEAPAAALSQEIASPLSCPATARDGLPMGCPCSIADSCAGGTYCTDAVNSLIVKFLGQSAGISTGKGFCLPCQAGDYCPKGTSVLLDHAPPDILNLQKELLAAIPQVAANLSVEEIEGLKQLLNITDKGEAALASLENVILMQLVKLQSSNRVNDIHRLACPEGYACPDPSQRIQCSNGTFCPQGSTKEVDCLLPAVFLNNPTVKMQRVVDDFLLDAVRSGEQLIEGNICPAGSADPSAKCPARFYCPTPREAVECPNGYYCPEGSTSPVRCPWLSGCRTGSDTASTSWGGFIIGAVIVIVMVLMIVLLEWYTRKNFAKQKAFAEKQESFNEIMTVAGLPQPEFRAFQDIPVKVSIQFRELTLTLKNGAKVLNGVTGEFLHSQLIAVMGGSGCGKSTFLNVLCGKANYGKMGGEVLVNGHELPLHIIRSIKGFVPQDDTVHEDLTVAENLRYSASIRLPRTYLSSKRKQLVLGTAELLQLTHVMDSVVGSVEKRGISGGQRKRVNIGVELVSQPSVLFLDEPTSGLDSTASLAVLQGLKRLCSRGMSSIMVIHQPRYSIFELFDKVLLLGRDGNQVFLGQSKMALPYFESKGFTPPRNENPADFFLDVIQGKVEREDDPDFEVQNLYDWWKSSGEEWLLNARALSSDAATPAGRLSSIPTLSRYTSKNVPRLKEALISKFDQLDLDRSGFLTPPDVASFVTSLGQACGEEQARHVIQAMNDYSGKPKVSREEFLKYGMMDGGAFDQLFASKTGPKANVCGRADEGQTHKYSGPQSSNGLPAQQSEATGTSRRPPGIPVMSDVSSRAVKGPSQPLCCVPADVESLAARPGAVQLLEVRRVCSPFGQMWIIFKRSARKYTRNWGTRLVDTVIVIVVSIVIGGIQGTNWAFLRVGVNFILYLIALGVIITTGTLRVFGSSHVVRWREVASGYNVFSIFVGMSGFDLVDVTFRPLVFSAIYWSLTATDISFPDFFLVSWLVSWWCSGLAYLLSAVIPPSSVVLAGACIPLVFAGFFNGYNPTLESMGAYSPMHLLTYLSYARWATEFLMVKFFEGQDIQFRLGSLAMMRSVGFCDFIFESALQQDLSVSGLAGNLTLMGIADDPVVKNSLIQGLALTFPSLYDGSQRNISAILEAFNLECASLRLSEEETDLCDALSYQYYNVAGYQRCENSSFVSLWVILGEGLILRILAFIALKFVNRGKMV